MIDRLELAELITRHLRSIDQDHRAVLVALTGQGRRTIRQFNDIFDMHLDDAPELMTQLSAVLRQRSGAGGSENDR